MKNVRDTVSNAVRTRAKSPGWSTLGSKVKDIVEDKVRSIIRDQVFDSLYVNLQENIDASWPIRKV
jgi:hypothetical protein